MDNQFQWSNTNLALNTEIYWILRRTAELNCLYIKLKYIYVAVPKEIKPIISNYINMIVNLNNTNLTLSEKFDYIICSFVNYATEPLQGLLYNYIPSTRENWEDLVIDIWNNNYFITNFDYI